MVEIETSQGKLAGVFLLVTEDTRFGIPAAKDPCVGFSETKIGENGSGEDFRGRRPGEIWSQNVWKQDKFTLGADYSFEAALLGGFLRGLG